VARSRAGAGWSRRHVTASPHHLAKRIALRQTGVVDSVEHSGEQATHQPTGHWHRTHPGEVRWPVSAVVLLVVGLQLMLPKDLRVALPGLNTAIELVLLSTITVLNPRRINRHRTSTRVLSLALAGVMSASNIWSGALLVHSMVTGGVHDATSLLLSGGSIWLTNVVVFALWYWEFDRGGPGARAQARHPFPDFLFPQMTDPRYAPNHWAPSFFDYLYTSFTNASAFSPTDVMPLSRWAKFLMLIQSTVSLLTVGLVIARAVNILR
jgi:uncharacterized membrane protein